MANFTVRFSLLLGRFEYTPRGLLDETHLRFFTRKSGHTLLASSGYRVVWTAPTAMPVELALPLLAKPTLAPLVRGATLFLARVWPTLFGYQFVWEAVPA